MPAASRISDFHQCPMQSPSVPPVPHVGGPIIEGISNVIIGGFPAATVGCTCTCTGPPDTIISGSKKVFINGLPAARLGDKTAHGGTITSGCFNVIIG